MPFFKSKADGEQKGKKQNDDPPLKQSNVQKPEK